MAIICSQLNPHACKTYLLIREGGTKAVLIDPVVDHVDAYRSLLKVKGYTLTHVIDTHTHADHISGGPAMRDMTDCEYVMSTRAPAACATIRADDGDHLDLPLGIIFTVFHTPGHTKDSMCLVSDSRLFTGDTLFLDDGGAGRDDLPGGDAGAHWESLQRLMSLPDNLTVYPAHDYRDRTPSSLGRQKETNPHLQKRSKADFVTYIEDLRLGPADWMTEVLKANYACARDPGAAWIPLDSPACEVHGTLDVGVNEIMVDDISPQILQELLRHQIPPLLLDVREEDELTGEHGHLNGIVHIPIGSLAKRMKELDPNRKIVTVCRSGSRAHTAAQILKKAGFPWVTVLNGGMIAWNRMAAAVT